jgi:hypothetical protein
MTGQQLYDASIIGDSEGQYAAVHTRRGVLHQLPGRGWGHVTLFVFLRVRQPLHAVAGKGHETVTEQFIVARCNVNLQKKNGSTLHYGHKWVCVGHEAAD